MGYTTDFDGRIAIEPALSNQEIKFLIAFAESRRMDRTKGPYYVEGSGFMGQNADSDVANHNSPPADQPGLWCQWVPGEDEDGNSVIEWDGNEKFYDSPEWMVYLIRHFIGLNPLAKETLPFLQSHTLNGTIAAQGEDPDDMWLLHVKNNVVTTEALVAQPSGDEQIIDGQNLLGDGETKLLGND